MLDAPIHYIVLNRNDNTFDMKFLDQYYSVLEKIEATKGPGVMITISAGKKLFSTGFNLSYWT